MITIDLKIALKVKVPDAKGVEHEYDLKEGLNDVPKEVAEHWYVAKFLRPVRRVPRVVIPSSARRPMKAAAKPQAPEAPAAVPAQPAAEPKPAEEAAPAKAKA